MKKIRNSSYNIVVKVDEEKELYAILNGYTQAFDIINKNVYDNLREERLIEHISEETKKVLIKRGFLTSLSKGEEFQLVKTLSDNAHNNLKLKKYNYHFILSYDCNLRCVYCYENEVLNGPNSLPKNRITKEQIDRALDIIIENDKNIKGNKIISLYGGEPFLSENFELIKYLVEKGSRLGYTFSATTNGYDLDKYMEFFKDNKCFSFQITVDGVKDIHNRRKPHCLQKNSFEKITNNIDTLLKLGFRVSVRINTDAYTITRIDELVEYFKQRGWLDHENFQANCALLRKEIPIAREEWEKIESIGQVDLFKEYCNKKLDAKIKCQDFGILYSLKALLLNKPIAYKGCFCGGQTGNMIFDPMGDVYSCWDVVGNSKHKIGKYYPDFEIIDSASKKWFDTKISDYKCGKCPYTLFCGGGCVIRSLNTRGIIEPGSCSDYPQLFNYIMKFIYTENIKENFTL